MVCNDGIVELPCHTSGDTFDGFEFTIQLDSIPIDLAGALISMSVSFANTVFLTLNSSNGGITITDATNGVFQVDEQIISLPPQNYFYEIKIVFYDGSIKTYVKGKWKILQ